MFVWLQSQRANNDHVRTRACTLECRCCLMRRLLLSVSVCRGWFCLRCVCNWPVNLFSSHLLGDGRGGRERERERKQEDDEMMFHPHVEGHNMLIICFQQLHLIHWHCCSTAAVTAVLCVVLHAEHLGVSAEFIHTQSLFGLIIRHPVAPHADHEVVIVTTLDLKDESELRPVKLTVSSEDIDRRRTWLCTGRVMCQFFHGQFRVWKTMRL